MVNKRVLAIVIVTFVIGWIANSLVSASLVFDRESPVSLSFVGLQKSQELSSPSDHLDSSQIAIYNDRVVLDVENAFKASFTDTNSMDPFIDETSNSIEIVPAFPEVINVGDVISYRSDLTGDLIIHRVIEVNEDNHGKYFIVKGDNNPTQDPEKIRFDQVHGVVIGVVY